MRIQVLASFLFITLLAACASAPITQTSEVVETLKVLPSPTATATPIPTATLSPTPDSIAIVSPILAELDYDAADHEMFAPENYRIEVREWFGEQVQMLIHTNPNDKQERIDGMEVAINDEKQWVRGLYYPISSDPNAGGFIVDIMVHPLQNERVQFADAEAGSNAVYGELVKAIANQLGVPAAQMPQYLQKHDYKVKIRLPENLKPGSKQSPSLLKASELVEVDLSKPVTRISRAEPYLSESLGKRVEIPETARFLWGDSRATQAIFVANSQFYLVETFDGTVANRRDYVESVNLWEFFELIAHMQNGYSDSNGSKGLIQWFIDTPFENSGFILDSTVFLNPNSHNTSFEPTILDIK